MRGRKFAFVSVGVWLGTAVVPAPVYAGALGTVEGLPFFGQPYPYGYVYHRPPVECYSVQMVDTPIGPRIEVAWICDGSGPVKARY